MSLLYTIINDTMASPNAKKSAYLIIIIKQLGWTSLTDKSVIKPSLQKTEVYLRKNGKILSTLFGIDFSAITRDDIVDTINPLLIHIWQVQIVGDPTQASLELLLNNK